mgnify:CR=1 FL=1
MQLPDLIVSESLRSLIKQAAEEFGYPAPSDEHIEQLIQTFSTREDSCLFFTEHGFLAGFITTGHILLPNIKTALEVAWYVHPEHRNKMEGGRLYKMFEEWAKENEAVYLFQGIKTRDSKKVSEIHLRKL